ncbi:type 1 glutamine amidotransferase [Candidatus Micrarchaeota archaeon]|nr:type 1 glutamine amidotransferase [Candidatus Micrarchaeota archaeon]
MAFSKRVALLSCEPHDQEPIEFKGKKRTVRDIISIGLKGHGLEPIIYFSRDKCEFPKKGVFAGIIIGGSKLSIFDSDIEKHDWMKKLLDFIRESHGKVPILGLCFGHQAIARAFGGTLKNYGPGICYEVGLSGVYLTEQAKKDPLFSGVPEQFSALFSHFSYVSYLPDSVVLCLSSNPENKSIQAFRVGEVTWGLQFHPEYSLEGIRDLITARREMIKHLIDVDAALKSLDDSKRFDIIPFRNFAAILKE